MMFADREDIETRRVGEFCCLRISLSRCWAPTALPAGAFGIRSPNV